jgi:hypothetical protein
VASVAGLPKTHLVVLALYNIGGESDLEQIAVQAWIMFPQQFCWRSYPQYPDKDAVRVHLSEAKKVTAGRLVIDKDLRRERGGDGTYVKRFALTSAGVEKAREVQRLLDSGAPMTATKNSRDYQRIVTPVLESDAFRRFSNGISMSHISRDSFLLAFRLFPDAAVFSIAGRLGRAESVIDQLPDSNEKNHLQRFIKEGRDAHKLQ